MYVFYVRKYCFAIWPPHCLLLSFDILKLRTYIPWLDSDTVPILLYMCDDKQKSCQLSLIRLINNLHSLASSRRAHKQLKSMV